MGFAAGLALSLRLWISSRFFPLIPVARGLPVIPYPLDHICAGLLLALLCAIGLASRPRPYIFSFAALLVFLALLDQTRWQPWVYLYLFMLLSLGCFSWKQEDISGQENTLNICRLIVVATYFYSGLQKMNLHFAAVGVASLFGVRVSRLLPLVHVWPWLIAATEAAIAVALLTRKYRNLAVIYGISMHLFILFSCIVIRRWNSVVWPWNVAMIAFLVLLFWNVQFSFVDIAWRNPIRFQKIILVLFGIMPLFSFFGLWDSYLSASLYSANVPEATVVFRGAVREQLPRRIRSYVRNRPAGTYMLKIGDWALGELNVPPYPAMRAYRMVGADICKYSNNSPDVVLLMYDKDTWLARGRQTQDTCLGTLLVDKW